MPQTRDPGVTAFPKGLKEALLMAVRSGASLKVPVPGNSVLGVLRTVRPLAGRER